MKRTRPFDADDGAISLRLHDELRRLKLNIKAVAVQCGVSWRMVYYWQRPNQHHPDTHHLLSMSRIGIDIPYLVSGVRSVSIAVDCTPGDNTNS